jgi:hypothetical protein
MGAKADKKKIISTAILAVLVSCASSSQSAPDPFGGTSSGGKKASDPPVFSFPTPPPTPPNTPEEFERCYGISGKDENDCGYASFDGEPNSCAGTAKACDPGAWRWVPKGTCNRIVVGTNAGGTILQGTLEPSMARGKPVRCVPYNPALLKSKDYGL